MLRQITHPNLFKPIEYGYEFKVIVTNRKIKPRKVVLFEGLARKRASSPSQDALPDGLRTGQDAGLYMFAAFAHNLTRESRSDSTLAPVARRQNAPRCGASARLRPFSTLIQRAGRIIRAGKLILSNRTRKRPPACARERRLSHTLRFMQLCQLARILAHPTRRHGASEDLRRLPASLNPAECDEDRRCHNHTSRKKRRL